MFTVCVICLEERLTVLGYVAFLDRRGHVVEAGPAGAVVDLALAGGGEVLESVHHFAALGDVVLLSVVHQRVTLTGRLNSGVTFLKF